MANIISDIAKARDIDRDEKNKFRCEWLMKTVTVKFGDKETDVVVGDSIKKVDVSGRTTCSICSDLQYYGKRGFSAISDHLKSKKHAEKVLIKDDNYSLPSTFYDTNTSNASTSASTPRNVPICDRVSNSEALILGVLAEHSLPFSMAEVIVDVSKTLADDRKALNHLVMKRASASYKMRFGLGKTFLESTVDNLKTSNFSLNIDESTSNNHMRVVSLLCSYFSSSVGKVVVEHLNSLSVDTVSAEILFNEIQSLFNKYDIPWENLISVLLDSCNVMRGSKAGLETRIRCEKAPHLLDVDGDSCHHIHNACKKFCIPFSMWLESLFKDIYNDIKWSADIKTCLGEICDVLSIKFVSPVSFIAHRWMSCYDAALNFVYLIDALTLLFYAFLSNEDKTVYFSILCTIYRNKNLSSSDRATIKCIQNKLSSKKLTDDGVKRKKRIYQKLFYYRQKTCLIANFYIAALPLLKKYILLFQTKEPLIHKVYDEQKQLFLDFLSCFMAQEHLQIKSAKGLLDIDILNDELHLPHQKIFIGARTQDVIAKSLNKQTVEDFLASAKKAYVQCAIHLQKRLPFNNQFLKCASAIDPTARGHQITCERLQKLPVLLCNVLSDEEKDKYQLEIFQYQVDMKLAPPVDDSGKLVAVDIWWAKVFNMPKYYTLGKIVKAVLSCFHGAQVEGSFNIMSDIIDKRSGRMQIQTYSAIQTVKYKLLAENKSAVQFFHKKNFRCEPVDRKLCYNLRSSRMCYQKELDEKKEKREQKAKNKTVPMKHKVAEICSVENSSRLNHKRKLEQMVQNIKKKKLKLK